MGNLIQTCCSCAWQFKRKNPKLSILSLIILTTWTLVKLQRLFQKPKSLKDKVVLVTGGVSGIGRLVALMCKLKGAVVIVWDINEKGLAEMKEIVAESMRVDITSATQIEREAKYVLKKFGHVDILINNAGIAHGLPLLELNKEQIRKTFVVNAISHFWTVQSFLPTMIKRESGHIVTISSCAAVQGVPRMVDYAASKSACRAFHDTLGIELTEQGVKKGIALTCVNPYFVKTGMFRGTILTRWWWLKPLGFDFLEPEYVASQILYAIEYEIAEMFIPDIMRIAWLLRYLCIPNSLATQIMASSGCFIKTH